MQPGKKRKKNASAMKLVGALLAQFRRAAGYTQESLTERICAQYDTVASIEQGRRPLKSDLAEQLDALLDTKGALAVAVANMPEMDKYPVWAAEFVDRESEAIALNWYENQVVPGLLQTERYARAVFHSRVPAASRDEIETQVGARIDRQEILQRTEPPTASFVISEAVLRDRLGGWAVYQEQLSYLRELVELPGLSLQIMPLGRESHAALDGPFILLETPDHEHLAYTETQRGSQLISEADEVSILAMKYAMLRTQALNPEEAEGLLDRLLGEA
ncbi:DNA-binding protein [Streptomyces abyssalis]|uniref:DNA-binding protein n=1 Tax=Streptomyces abyssalis TaxID=933944 RepID=A0A1E7JJB5_9ACTN|nr:helix-turn-helix transcriptional regulator [Streptomyces abyssalis]OEU87181.1 DNA-binding protein [Streptomyces abyssalis]OEU87715.1 DNA-binding protein [Streptomyces abyssalis]